MEYDWCREHLPWDGQSHSQAAQSLLGTCQGLDTRLVQPMPPTQLLSQPLEACGSGHDAEARQEGQVLRSILATNRTTLVCGQGTRTDHRTAPRLDRTHPRYFEPPAWRSTAEKIRNGSGGCLHARR